MKRYTFDGVYEGKVAELTDAYIEANNREPDIIEKVWISGEARQYAKDFMENYVEWQIERGHEEREREHEKCGD